MQTDIQIIFNSMSHYDLPIVTFACYYMYKERLFIINSAQLISNCLHKQIKTIFNII